MSDQDQTSQQPAAQHAPGVEHGEHIAREHEFGAEYTTRLTLAKPIQRGGGMAPLLTLYLREPTAADLKGVSLANLANFYEAGEVTTVLQRVAMPKLSPQEAGSLKMRDAVNAGNALSHFLA